MHLEHRGFLFAKLSSYTSEESENYGQLTRAQIEQSAEVTQNLHVLNQLRWTSNSLMSDLSQKSPVNKKDNFSVYLGENFIKYKSENWIAQFGYQEVVWGEAYGFNYADIINPKDLRQTFFNDAGESRLPLLLFNGKYFFSEGDFSGSMQFLYSPEPRFSKTLPVELFVGDFLPQPHLTVIKEKTPKLFESSDIGGKLGASYSGFDFSLFYFSYLEREPHYIMNSASLTDVTINEKHSKVNSSGLSVAKTIYDFVLRSDIVYTQDKPYNYLLNSELKTFSSDSLNALISLDTPTYNDFSGVLVLARSHLVDILPLSFRQQNEQYMVGKITKKFASEKTLDLIYVHEFDHAGHSVQTSFNWPINSSTDLKLGGEFYFGENSSNLKKYQKINSLFFSLKNFIQL